MQDAEASTYLKGGMHKATRDCVERSYCFDASKSTNSMQGSPSDHEKVVPFRTDACNLNRNSVSVAKVTEL